MNKKSVLVTGGFGNLGAWIVRNLCEAGYQVYVWTRGGDKQLAGIEYQTISCDLTDLNSVKASLDFPIDYCVHLTSYNEFFLDNYFEKALQINTLGTRNLLEVLAEKPLKNFIYFSTVHVYGVNEGVVTEESELAQKMITLQRTCLPNFM